MPNNKNKSKTVVVKTGGSVNEFKTSFAKALESFTNNSNQPKGSKQQERASSGTQAQKEVEQIVNRTKSKTGSASATNRNFKRGPSAGEILKGFTVDALHWSKAYGDPFQAKEVSMPVGPILYHQNLKNHISGTGACNANGKGWITVIPTLCVTKDQTYAVTVSNISSSDLIEPPGVTGTTTQYAMNGPYTSADYNNQNISGKQFRIAALGIRVRYFGIALEAAGACYTIQLEPKKVSPEGLIGYGINDIKNSPSWKEYNFMNGEWHSITRHITSMKDFDYQCYDQATTTFSYAELAGGTAGGAPVIIPSMDNTTDMAIYMSSSANATFEFEVVCHYEAVGQDLPSQTIVPENEAKVKEVVSAFKQARSLDNLSPDHSVDAKPLEQGGWVSFLKESALKVLPYAADALVGLLA
jgi:hypothetical protein